MGAVAPPLAPRRVAVLFPGDAEDPSVRSGTPYGVLTGLRSWGVEVVALDVRASPRAERALALALSPTHHRTPATSLRQRVRRGYSAALVGADVARWRSAVARRRLRSVGPLDGVVQLGAGYEVADPAAPLAVYDDMTVAQALEHPYPAWQALRERDVRARLAMQERVYASATACCMTSSWVAASATARFGVARERVHVVGAGTHESPRHPGRDWSVPRFLLVGLDFERKNGARVLRAFARVRRAHPGARLDVVGGHPPIDQDGVVGHGRLSRRDPAQAQRLRELFDAATCFVMPSLHEPAGVVFTEAAAAALPSVGGTVGGSADFIGDGGLVVDPTDDDAVVEAMLALCDPGLAERTGALAAARSPLFTWRAVAGRLLGALGLDGLGEDLPDDLPLRPPSRTGAARPGTGATGRR